MYSSFEVLWLYASNILPSVEGLWLCGDLESISSCGQDGEARERVCCLLALLLLGAGVQGCSVPPPGVANQRDYLI